MNLKIRPQGGPVGLERLLVQEDCQVAALEDPSPVGPEGDQHPQVGPEGDLAHPVEHDLVDYRVAGPHLRGVREVRLGQVDSVPVGCQVAGRVRLDGLEGPEAGSDLVDYQVQARVRPDARVAHHVAVVFWTTTITKTTSLCAQVACLAVGHVLEDYLVQRQAPDPDHRAGLADCLVRGLDRRAAQAVYRVADPGRRGVLV